MNEAMTADGRKHTFKRAMQVLFTLTAMQLKEKLDFGFLSNTKKTIFKCVYFLLEFSVITAVCFLFFYLCKAFKVFSEIGDFPVSVVSVVFTVMLALSVVFDTIGLVKTLYLSRDNLVLLTYPSSPSLVFLSKLAVYYVYEIKKNFLFLIPFFIGYGIAQGHYFYYYFWVLVAFAFISML
ncbi:MAG: hypothetical protein J5903_02445, partial [Clostridia bacterium]|nr:hypothetical protein [Clostridia bacterium]